MSAETPAKFTDKCRYFNGIQHVQCDAGVAYDALLVGGAYRLPCLGDPSGLDTRPKGECSECSYLTHDEHVSRNAERQARVQELLQLLRDGRCPVCKGPIEPSKIVGRCKYAACGHRVGQVSR